MDGWRAADKRKYQHGSAYAYQKLPIGSVHMLPVEMCCQSLAIKVKGKPLTRNGFGARQTAGSGQQWQLC
jgi:hypothetical protein